jgi:hypothetical protein
MQHSKEDAPKTVASTDDLSWQYFKLHPAVQIVTVDVFDPASTLVGVGPGMVNFVKDSNNDKLIGITGLDSRRCYQLWVCAMARECGIQGFLAVRLLVLVNSSQGLQWQERFVTPWQASTTFTSYRFHLDLATALGVDQGLTPPTTPITPPTRTQRIRSNSTVSNSSITSESQTLAESMSDQIHRTAVNLPFGVAPSDLTPCVTKAIGEHQTIVKMQLLYRQSVELNELEVDLFDLPCVNLEFAPVLKQTSRPRRAQSQPMIRPIERIDSTSTVLTRLTSLDRRGSVMSLLADQLDEANIEGDGTTLLGSIERRGSKRSIHLEDASEIAPKRRPSNPSNPLAADAFLAYIQQQKIEEQNLREMEEEVERHRLRLQLKDTGSPAKKKRAATLPSMSSAPKTGLVLPKNIQQSLSPILHMASNFGSDDALFDPFLYGFEQSDPAELFDNLWK